MEVVGCEVEEVVAEVVGKVVKKVVKKVVNEAADELILGNRRYITPALVLRCTYNYVAARRFLSNFCKEYIES